MSHECQHDVHLQESEDDVEQILSQLLHTIESFPVDVFETMRRNWEREIQESINS